MPAWPNEIYTGSRKDQFRRVPIHCVDDHAINDHIEDAHVSCRHIANPQSLTLKLKCGLAVGALSAVILAPVGKLRQAWHPRRRVTHSWIVRLKAVPADERCRGMRCVRKRFNRIGWPRQQDCPRRKWSECRRDVHARHHGDNLQHADGECCRSRWYQGLCRHSSPRRGCRHRRNRG